MLLCVVDEPFGKLIIFVEEEIELCSFNIMFFFCTFGLSLVPLGSFCAHVSILIKNL